MNVDDPRVKRTRKLLEEAVISLLQEKSFHSLSVQEIAERATLNRATFYAHFEDKYALMDWMVRDLFQETLRRRVTPSMPFTPGNLRLLMVTVFEFLDQFHGHCSPADAGNGYMLEAKVQEELAAFLARWLDHFPRPERAAEVSHETAATVMSWAIFGAGAEWSRRARAISADEWARTLLPALAGVVERVAPAPEWSRPSGRSEPLASNGAHGASR